jgi:DNA-binding NtrC family response regulator
MTKNQFTILIADRNPRVRELLRREFTSSGYRVLLAENGGDVLKIVNADQVLDLLILDIDIPYPGGLTVLNKLQRWKPQLPVVVYTYFTEYAKDPAVERAAGFLEKQGDNIGRLKEMVAQILQKAHPNRFPLRCNIEERPPGRVLTVETNIQAR